MTTRSPVGESTGTSFSLFTPEEEADVLRALPVLSYPHPDPHDPTRYRSLSIRDSFSLPYRLLPPRSPTPSKPKRRRRHSLLAYIPSVHSTATHNSADAWQMPLHNKDRLFLVLLPTVGTSGEEEWALLLTPKREKKGAPESTLFRVFWEETEKGPWLSYHSRTVDATALPMLARWLLLKIRPGQQEFFDDELSSVDILQEKGWRSRGWVGSCLSRLRELGFGEIREPKAVEEEVGRWRTAVWDRGGRARGETVADLRLRS